MADKKLIAYCLEHRLSRTTMVCDTANNGALQYEVQKFEEKGCYMCNGFDTKCLDYNPRYKGCYVKNER